MGRPKEPKMQKKLNPRECLTFFFWYLMFVSKSIHKCGALFKLFLLALFMVPSIVHVHRIDLSLNDIYKNTNQSKWSISLHPLFYKVNYFGPAH